jgi:hypothetical protein
MLSPGSSGVGKQAALSTTALVLKCGAVVGPVLYACLFGVSDNPSEST